MNQKLLEQRLAELPLYAFFFISPQKLEFSDRVRWICEHECTQYGKTWACPPGVGSVKECKAHCTGYQSCLVIATAAEVEDISSLEQTLATRSDHEDITNEAAQILRELGAEPFVLSTESCAICPECTILSGKPCRHPDKMHPCVESQGINVIPVLEENGLSFQYGQNVVTWISMLLYNP